MCGGVSPNLPHLTACTESPNLASGNDELMAYILDRVLKECSEHVRSERNLTKKNRILFMKQLTNKNKATLLRANFAAADYAYKMERGLPYTWQTLQGGVFAKGDLHTCNHYGEV